MQVDYFSILLDFLSNTGVIRVNFQPLLFIYEVTDVSFSLISILDKFRSSFSEFLDNERNKVSDLVPNFLVGQSHHYLVFPLRYRDQYWFSVVAGKVGFRAIGVFGFFEVSFRMYAIYYLKVVHSLPIQLALYLVAP